MSKNQSKHNVNKNYIINLGGMPYKFKVHSDTNIVDQQNDTLIYASILIVRFEMSTVKVRETELRL